MRRPCQPKTLSEKERFTSLPAGSDVLSIVPMFQMGSRDQRPGEPQGIPSHEPTGMLGETILESTCETCSWPRSTMNTSCSSSGKGHTHNGSPSQRQEEQRTSRPNFFFFCEAIIIHQPVSFSFVWETTDGISQIQDAVPAWCGAINK